MCDDNTSSQYHEYVDRKQPFAWPNIERTQPALVVATTRPKLRTHAAGRPRPWTPCPKSPLSTPPPPPSFQLAPLPGR